MSLPRDTIVTKIAQKIVNDPEIEKILHPASDGAVRALHFAELAAAALEENIDALIDWVFKEVVPENPAKAIGALQPIMMNLMGTIGQMIEPPDEETP